MSSENRKKQPKPINGDKLNDLALSAATIKMLTGKIGEPMEFTSNTPEVHDSVKKLNGEKPTYTKLTPREKKVLEHIIVLKDKSNAVDEKLSKLQEQKNKHKSDKKLEHEREYIARRAKAAAMSKKNNSAAPTSAKELNAQIAAKYAGVSAIKVKPKNTPSKEGKTIPENDIAKMFTTGDVKKIKFSSNKSAKADVKIKDMNILSESSKYFAKELGWIEDDRPKRKLDMQSPLMGYSLTKEQKENEVFDDNTQDIIVTEGIYKDEFADNDYSETQEELDLKTINELAKKYKKEAENVQKQLEKEAKKIASIPDLSQIYEKILGKKEVKVSRVKKENSAPKSKNTEVDISKIPSFVLEEQRRRNNKG